MPRKGSRRVEVAGVGYRWMVRGNIHRYKFENPIHQITLTCQRDEDRPGRVMQITLTASRYRPAFTGRRAGIWVDETEQLSALTPADVRAVIEHALKHGWDPSERGAPYEPSGGIILPEFRRW